MTEKRPGIRENRYADERAFASFREWINGLFPDDKSHGPEGEFLNELPDTDDDEESSDSKPDADDGEKSSDSKDDTGGDEGSSDDDLHPATAIPTSGSASSVFF